LQSYQKDLLTSEQWLKLFFAGQHFFDHNQVTFTGGEPFLRRDLLALAKAIYLRGGKITITTNGFYLASKIHIGNYIDKLNVSLHSLDQNVYSAITHSEASALQAVIYGLQMFKQAYPKTSVVLNTALVCGVSSNLEQVTAMVQLATLIGAEIKFVELYPPSTENFVTLSCLADTLKQIGFAPIPAPFRKTCYSNGEITVSLTQIFCSFAKSEANPRQFCQINNDLFITPEGKIKPCRHDNREFDLKPYLEDNTRQGGLIAAIEEAIDYLGTNSTCAHLTKGE
jgi:cyclic pyranopterin phosphate synthase